MSSLFYYFSLFDYYYCHYHYYYYFIVSFVIFVLMTYFKCQDHQPSQSVVIARNCICREKLSAVNVNNVPHIPSFRLYVQSSGVRRGGLGSNPPHWIIGHSDIVGLVGYAELCYRKQGIYITN